MDKLKPILAQKFWIFFGLVLILPVVGYFMTVGALAEQIKTRWDSLNSTFGGIPTGEGSPNESWTKTGQLLNEKLKINNRVANEELWSFQRKKMRWPDDVAAVMSKAEYFQAVTPEQGGSEVPHKYQYDYPREIRRLWEIVDPVEDGKNRRNSDTRKKIVFAMADLHQTNTARWVDFPPTFLDMWECQEDIWLQTELLQAIAEVNKSSISLGDSFVKQLGRIQLFGATKAAGDAGGTTAPGNSSPGGPMEGNPFGGGGGPMGFGGGGRTGAAALSAEINLAEEFTVFVDPNVLTGTGGSGTGAMLTSFGEGTSSTAPAASPAGGKAESKRYIDEDANQPYKRRGFYIKVVMDHTKVPDLIAELMNSPFPVEIVRVQQVWLSDSASTPGGGGASPFMPAASAGGGFPGFNPAGADAGLSSSADDGGGAPARPTSGGASGTGSQSAMSDPNLAQVAILGVWTLYRPPPPAADAGQPAPGTAAPMPEVAATPAAETQPSEATEKTPAAPAVAETTGDEPKKPEAGEAPKTEATKPEKPEAESDKPAEKSPPPQEPSEKPATDPKS